MLNFNFLKKKAIDPLGSNHGNTKALIDLVEGDIDPICGARITYLVLKSSDFIVYIDHEDDISWSTNNYEDFAEDIGMVTNKAKMLEHIVDTLFFKKAKREFKCLIGEGIARVLDDRETGNALKILKEVEQAIWENGRQKLRTSYILGSILTTLISIILILASWTFRYELIALFGESAFTIILSFFCGGIGAFISSFTRSLNFSGDVRIPARVYSLDGFLRIFYGMIAGFVMALAIKSNIVLGLANDVGTITIPLLCFLATVAGASESLIPSIIKKIEEQK